MPAAASRRRPRPPHQILKPHGTLHPRVQIARPEHFAILSVDCAKDRSKWMLADFFGRVLIPPTTLDHTRDGFDAALAAVARARADSGIVDLVVAVERTGRYHLPAKRAFAAAGLDVRAVHPFATKQFRQPADPGNKTDDTDLSAIHRATANGFGLREPAPEAAYELARLLARHRRDLVEKAAALRCQALEHLHAILPGYAGCFADVFDCKYAMMFAEEFGSAAAITEAGAAGLRRRAARDGVACQAPTLEAIVAWARTAPAADDQAATHRRILARLEADRRAKAREVAELERELAAVLVRTPYVLLLGAPGINVVSAAELAGEMGPIGHYPAARAITGRAGLYPARHQSDRVDRKDGPLVRCANRELRRAILMVADNLIACNDHFRGLAAKWRAAGKDPRDIRVKVGDRFCRVAYQVVAGRRAYRHPCCRHRHAVLEKLIKFHDGHDTEIIRVLADLEAAAGQLPAPEYGAEAAPLAEELARVRGKRGAGARRLGEILPAVLAKLGVHAVESPSSGEVDLR